MRFTPMRRANDMLRELESQALDLLADVLVKRVYGRFALVSSFGAESVVLLHLVSRIKPDTPVIFLDTNMLFQETLEYQLSLSAQFNLTDIRRVSPEVANIKRDDNFGRLHIENADRCCDLRKVTPLQTALQEFDGWITGRKRNQAESRRTMPLVESNRKVNPLAFWSIDDVASYMTEHALPRHPLVAKGFGSIGCAPCTSQNTDENLRSGRWANSTKTECGIHFGADGKIVRPAA